MQKKSLKTGASNANQSTDKLLCLIEFLSERTDPMRLVDIADQLNMNISTVLRFLNALQARGYVAQDIDSGRYSLTFKICRLGNNVKTNANLRNVSLPYMQSVSQSFGESVSLVIDNDMAVMYLEVVSGPHQMIISMHRIGNIAPMHCTDAGKLFLLEYTPHQMEQLIAVKGLSWYTEHTITTIDRLRKELIQVRHQGFAYDREECELGAVCVAAPIKDYTNRTVAALSVSGPLARMTNEHIYDKLPYLIDAAMQISVRMGYDAGKDEKPKYRR